MIYVKNSTGIILFLMMETKSIRQTVAKNIRKYRKEHGLTQEKLAELADISNTYIANIECGKTWVSDKTLEKISDALHVDAYLFFIMQKTEETPSEETPQEILESLKKADELKTRICASIQNIFDGEVKQLITESKRKT